MYRMAQSLARHQRKIERIFLHAVTELLGSSVALNLLHNVGNRVVSSQRSLLHAGVVQSERWFWIHRSTVASGTQLSCSPREIGHIRRDQM